MVELPWQRANRDIERVERDLRALLDDLQCQLDILSKEIDNDIDETVTVVLSVKDMVSSVEKEIERIKRSSGCQHARIGELEDAVFNVDDDVDIGSGSTLGEGDVSSTKGDHQHLHHEVNSVSTSGMFAERTKKPMMLRVRQAIMANMANMRNHGYDLFFFTAIISLCAAGITYLMMIY